MTADTRRPEMKVFIGWSGERSKTMAQALHDWIPLILHNVDPWVSEADIEAGERWGEVVAKELADSTFGIICVTRENVNSPWVLFEAGALAKTMQGSKVIPLLLDLEIRDITGPLAQFQAKKVEKSGVSEVINSINQTANGVVPEARARELFEALWPKLEKEVKAIPKQPAAEKHVRPQHEILEELVVSVRALDSRLREVTEGGPLLSRRRKMRIHPMMMMDIMHMGKRGPQRSSSIANVGELLSGGHAVVVRTSDGGLSQYKSRSVGRGRKGKARFQTSDGVLHTWTHGRGNGSRP